MSRREAGRCCPEECSLRPVLLWQVATWLREVATWLREVVTSVVVATSMLVAGQSLGAESIAVGFVKSGSTILGMTGDCRLLAFAPVVTLFHMPFLASQSSP